MRILVLAQYYAPEPIPKPVELAAELRQRGHEVTVVTGLPNYPSGQLYDGYRLGWVQLEELDGIRVVRTFEYPYHGTNSLGRILNYFSFMCSAPFGLRHTPVFDVIYVWHPPLTVGVAAWVMSRLRGVPFVYDLQDIWPESAVLAGMLTRPWLIRLMHGLERFVYRRAGHIFVVTEGARDNLIAKGVPASKVSVAAHWIDETIFEPAERTVADIRAQHGLEDRIIVMFAGNMGVVQGLETVITAADLLRDTRIAFVFVGDGSDRERLRASVHARRLQNVVFIDRQPLERMPAILQAADALLVHLKDSALTDLVIPTKTIAYLASGKPIVMAMRGAAASLIDRAEAGVVVPPENATALASGCRLLMEMTASERERLGRNGRAYLAAHHTREHVVNDYEKVLLAHARQGSQGAQPVVRESTASVGSGSAAEPPR